MPTMNSAVRLRAVSQSLPVVPYSAQRTARRMATLQRVALQAPVSAVSALRRACRERRIRVAAYQLTGRSPLRPVPVPRALQAPQAVSRPVALPARAYRALR